MYYITDELYHHGIKGQKWGVRRYQNEDGSVTAAGAKRYYGGVYGSNAKYYNKRAGKLQNKADVARTMASMNRNASSGSSGLLKKTYDSNDRYYTKKADRLQKRADSAKTMASMNEAAAKRQAEKREARNTPEAIEAHRKKAKKAAIIAGTAVVAAGLAVYGAKKLDDKATKGLAAKYEKKAKNLFYDAQWNKDVAEQWIERGEKAKRSTLAADTKSAIVSNSRKMADKYRYSAEKAEKAAWDSLKRSKGGFDNKEKVQYLVDNLKKKRR